MTITYTAEQVRELVRRDAERKNPGKLIGPIFVCASIDKTEDHLYMRGTAFGGMVITVLDQSPFGISPERVKRGFDEAREAVRRVQE